jgi:hypothetical protein
LLTKLVDSVVTSGSPGRVRGKGLPTVIVDQRNSLIDKHLHTINQSKLQWRTTRQILRVLRAKTQIDPDVLFVPSRVGSAEVNVVIYFCGVRSHTIERRYVAFNLEPFVGPDWAWYFSVFDKHRFGLLRDSKACKASSAASLTFFTVCSLAFCKLIFLASFDEESMVAFHQEVKDS